MNERTQALIAENTPIETRICHAAADYFHAQSNESFARAAGGVVALHNELQKLVQQWQEQL